MYFSISEIVEFWARFKGARLEVGDLGIFCG